MMYFQIREEEGDRIQTHGNANQKSPYDHVARLYTARSDSCDRQKSNQPPVTAKGRVEFRPHGSLLNSTKEWKFSRGSRYQSYSHIKMGKRLVMTMRAVRGGRRSCWGDEGESLPDAPHQERNCCGAMVKGEVLKQNG